MGLPNINITFRTKGVTAIERSARGIVALLIRDATEGVFEQVTYKSIADVDFTKIKQRNYEYLKLLYRGSPSKVLVFNVGAEGQVSDVLKKIAGLKFNYLSMPEATSEEVLTISTWIKERRAEQKTYKAVLPNCKADHEGIINFTTDGILSIVSETKFTVAEYCTRIAGLLAGLPLSMSATYFVLDDIVSASAPLDAAERIKKGELVIVYDGENYKIGRGINSFITYTTEKGKDFSKIKIIEGIDLYTDDVQEVFEKSYIGKYRNDYDTKQAFVAAINAYNTSLEGDVLDQSHDNVTSIDVKAQRLYLESQGIDTTEMSEMQIKTANTGSKVFLRGSLKFVDAMEDLDMHNYL